MSHSFIYKHRLYTHIYIYIHIAYILNIKSLIEQCSLTIYWQREWVNGTSNFDPIGNILAEYLEMKTVNDK